VAIVVPAFAGHTLPDPTDGIVALIGIVVLTSLAAWVTSGYGLASSGGTLAGAGGVSTGGVGTGAGAGPRSSPRFGSTIALWAAVGIAGIGLVVYQLGPLLQERDQRDLMAEYRTTLHNAANESSGLAGVKTVTEPPEEGSAVGIVEIPQLRAQQVVVEGVSASDTQKGPGHVPGTAGLGQPGNAAIVARRNAFGGSFRDLARLHEGDRILVTTTQGETVYAVTSVSTKTITNPPSADDTSGSTASAGASARSSSVRAVTVDALYGPTNNDRLTLVTSATRAPWNSSDATVVVAKMQGKPFAPTPQAGRTTKQTGRGGDGSAWASVVLVLLALTSAVVASVFIYRKLRFRVAYILTIAPLVALTVVAGVTISRLLPAWM
jgi:sortase A